MGREYVLPSGSLCQQRLEEARKHGPTGTWARPKVSSKGRQVSGRFAPSMSCQFARLLMASFLRCAKGPQKLEGGAPSKD